MKHEDRKTMKFTFLGTGDAFFAEYGNSATIVELNGKKILVDCGHTVYPILRKTGLINDIDYLLITHLHDDHAGSLSTFLFYSRFFNTDRKLKLLVPDEEFKETLIQYLSFSMQIPEMFVHFEDLSSVPGILPINTYGQHVPEMQSYGFVFQEDDQSVVFSGDISQAKFTFDKLAEMRITPTMVFHELIFIPNSMVHTYYKDLIEYLPLCPIYGYHCNPTLNPMDNPIPLVYDNPQFLVKGLYE